MRKYPAIVQAMGRRHEMYNAQLDYIHQQATLGNTMIIAPSEPLPIGRVEMNPTKMQKVYFRGRATCDKLIPAIKKFLSGN